MRAPRIKQTLRRACDLVTARDAEWTRIVLDITDKILTPEQAAKWLANDRVQRARKVADARQRRTPPNW